MRGRRNERQIGRSQKIIENNPKEKIIIFASDRDAMKTIQSGLGIKQIIIRQGHKSPKGRYHRISALTLIKSFSPIGRRGNGIELRGSKHSNSLGYAQQVLQVRTKTGKKLAGTKDGNDLPVFLAD